MKTIYAKLCLIILSASIVCALILAPALASAPSNDDSSSNATEITAETASETTAAETDSTNTIPVADDGTSLTNDGPYTKTMQTSAQAMKRLLRNANISSTVTLNEGNHEKWIDRIDVDETAKNFYDMLEEATDNDGINDYLIDDKYFDSTATTDTNSSNEKIPGNYYVFKDKNASGSEETVCAVIYDAIPSSDENSVARQNLAVNSMAAVYAAFDRDHPEVFWLGDLFSFGSLTETIAGVETVYPYYVLGSESYDTRATGYTSEETIETAITENNTNVSSIMRTSEVSGASTNHDKVVAFNNWLTKNNAYNSSVAGGASGFTVSDHPDVWECTSALAGRTGETGPVCEGYARAFKVLCDRVNIPCVLVDGTAKSSSSSTGGAHMWNYVQVGSKWYGVDVTWNDPYSDDENADMPTSGYEVTTWLLVGSATKYSNMPFTESHPVTNCLFSGSVEFTNGPELSTTSYAEDADAAETVDLENYGLIQTSPLNATYGDLLKNIQLEGLSMKTSDGAEVTGTFAWKSPEQQIKSCVDASYPAIFTIDGNETKTKNVDIQLAVCQKELTVNAGTINNKTYDGTTDATFSTPPTLDGVITDDDVSLTYSAAFIDAAVGTNKPVTITYTLTGAAKDNYELSTTTEPATASINKKGLVVISGVVENKTYDGSTTASFSTPPKLDGVITDDDVSLSSTAVFENKNAGTNKPVTITYSLNGNDADNYALPTNTATTTASIGKKELTVTYGVVEDKTYDGTTAATFSTNPTISGAITGDNVSLIYSAVFTNADVGDNKAVTITYGLTGTDAGNYELSKEADTAVASIKNPEPVVIPVAGLSLNKNEATITGAGTVKLEVAISPVGATDNTVQWTSSNSQVATVDENGIVTSVGKGTATITVTSVSSPDISDSCTVTVSNPVTRITLNPIKLDLVKGHTDTVRAVLQGAFAGSVDDDSVSWSSSDTNVVIVDNSGTVTALSSGQATITASIGSLHATCTVTVTNPANSIALFNSTKPVTVGDAAFKLTATVDPADADGSISWHSSNPKVATVSSDGMVEIVGVGQTTITASIGDLSTTRSITVNAKQIETTATESDYDAGIEITDATSAKNLDKIISGKGEVHFVVKTPEPEEMTDAVLNVLDELETSGITVTEIVDIFFQGNQGQITIDSDDGVSMTVHLEMTDAMKKLKSDKLWVYYVGDDGKLEDMKAVVDGTKLIFTTTHFSTYIVTDKEYQQQELGSISNNLTDPTDPTEPAEPTEPDVNNVLVKTPAPYYVRVSSGLSVTGDSTVDLLLAIGGVALLSAIIALIAARKKNKKH